MLVFQSLLVSGFLCGMLCGFLHRLIRLMCHPLLFCSVSLQLRPVRSGSLCIRTYRHDTPRFCFIHSDLGARVDSLVDKYLVVPARVRGVLQLFLLSSRFSAIRLALSHLSVDPLRLHSACILTVLDLAVVIHRQVLLFILFVSGCCFVLFDLRMHRLRELHCIVWHDVGHMLAGILQFLLKSFQALLYLSLAGGVPSRRWCVTLSLCRQC
mmetsp:Transcript_127076/g.220195  ORF Transcript_127076/g.220195 Transcript_127076/m.220195 type:complete len:211 (+) Transcript_127076:2230-2862(+)